MLSVTSSNSHVVVADSGLAALARRCTSPSPLRSSSPLPASCRSHPPSGVVSTSPAARRSQLTLAARGTPRTWPTADQLAGSTTKLSTTPSTRQTAHRGARRTQSRTGPSPREAQAPERPEARLKPSPATTAGNSVPAPVPRPVAIARTTKSGPAIHSSGRTASPPPTTTTSKPPLPKSNSASKRTPGRNRDLRRAARGLTVMGRKIAA